MNDDQIADWIRDRIADALAREGPFIFEYPEDWDLREAERRLKWRRKKGWFTSEECQQIDNHGVLYIPINIQTGDLQCPST